MSSSQSEFDRKDVIRLAKAFCPNIYSFLEGVQPYQPGQAWLSYLMIMSNTDKHEVINEVVEPGGIVDVAGLHADGSMHRKPSFLGSSLVIASGSNVHLYQLPYYYEPYGMFALEGERWSLFLVSVSGIRVGLMPFINNTPGQVKRLTDHFMALF